MHRWTHNHLEQGSEQPQRTSLALLYYFLFIGPTNETLTRPTVPMCTGFADIRAACPCPKSRPVDPSYSFSTLCLIFSEYEGIFVCLCLRKGSLAGEHAYDLKIKTF